MRQALRWLLARELTAQQRARCGLVAVTVWFAAYGGTVFGLGWSHYAGLAFAAVPMITFYELGRVRVRRAAASSRR